MGLEALRVNDTALQDALGKDRSISPQELESTEAQIMARLKGLLAIREQLMLQVLKYLAEAREQDELLPRPLGRGCALLL